MKLYLAILAVTSSTAFVAAQTGEVYLTFDDGPIDATFGVLDGKNVTHRVICMRMRMPKSLTC